MRIRLLAIPLSALALASACSTDHLADGPVRPTPVTVAAPPTTTTTTAPFAPPTSNPVLLVTPPTASLHYGESKALTAAVDGKIVEAAWRSSNPDAVLVNDTGVVTCHGAGEATVTASFGSGSTIPGTADVACFDDVAVEVTSSLSFEHIIGTSPCPTSAGFITVKLVGGPKATVVATSEHSALVLRTSRADLGRNGEARFEVLFNCGLHESFTGNIVVTVEGEHFDHFVKVKGNVHP